MSALQKKIKKSFQHRCQRINLRLRRLLLVVCSAAAAILLFGGLVPQTSFASGPVGPVTSWHYTPNSNFDTNGNYLPASSGFNLVDVDSTTQLSEVPSGDKALVWIGLCNGADSTFISTITPYIHNAKVFGYYLMDEPDPIYSPICPAANLKAESDWVHSNDPGKKTFIILMNLSNSKTPDYTGSYTPVNSDIDLFGIDPYPCRTELGDCDYHMINAYVAAAESFGTPESAIVPVYQAFGGGNYPDDGNGYWFLPTATEETTMLATWKTLVPNPAFDYAYSWGSQQNDLSLNGSSSLQQVFTTQNTPQTPESTSNSSHTKQTTIHKASSANNSTSGAHVSPVPTTKNKSAASTQQTMPTVEKPVNGVQSGASVNQTAAAVSSSHRSNEETVLAVIAVFILVLGGAGLFYKQKLRAFFNKLRAH